MSTAENKGAAVIEHVHHMLAAVRMVPLREAARYAEVPLATMRGWVKRGVLPAYRIGPRLLQIDLDDVDALRRRRTAPSVSNAEARAMLDWAHDVLANELPEELVRQIPWCFTQPVLLVFQRAVDNRTQLTGEDIAAAREAVEGGVAWFVEQGEAELTKAFAGPTLAYLDRLAAEID